MARTQQQVFDEMVTAKASQPALDILDSSSFVAYWRLLLWVVAGAIVTFEGLLDIFRSEIDAKIATAPFGHLLWWQRKALEYQHGDELTVTADIIGYDVVDESLCIVKAAAAIEDTTVPGGVLIKVAVLNGSNEFEPLDTTQANGLRAYLSQLKPAGPEPTVVSLNGDIFRLEGVFKFNPLLMANDGSLLSNPSVWPLEVAIDDYRRALDFDGVIDLHRLQDAVQRLDSCNNFYLGDASINLGSGFNPIGFRYTTLAGYALLATTPGDKLRDTITYLPGY